MKFGFKIPAAELRLTFARSGGPGGQNVNKVSTKVILRWDPAASSAFSREKHRQLLAHPLIKSRMNQQGELVMHEDQNRSQARNRETVIKRLYELVAQALVKPKKRKVSATPRAVHTERLREKKRQKERLKNRRVRTDD